MPVPAVPGGGFDSLGVRFGATSGFAGRRLGGRRGLVVSFGRGLPVGGAEGWPLGALEEGALMSN